MRNVHTRIDPVGRRSAHGGMFPTYKRAAKRRAKRQEWAGFVREQRALAQADSHSAEVEAREAREAEDAAFCAAMDAQADREYELQVRQDALIAMRQRWLGRMGKGTLFWENPCVDRWFLAQVDVVEYYDHEVGCEGFEFAPATMFALSVNRTTQQWELFDVTQDRVEKVPFEEASLDDMQALANALARLA